MKSILRILQIGFVGICALSTMSFTVADHAGALNKIASLGKHKTTYTCDGVNDYSKVTDITTGTVLDAKASPGITCFTPVDCYQFTTTSTSVCDNTSTLVCCFTKTTTSCSVPPNSGFKATIHCNSKLPQ